MHEGLIDEGSDQSALRWRQPLRTEAVAVAGALDLRRRPALNEDESSAARWRKTA